MSKDYGFKLKACKSRAKTKGKVERFNHYLKQLYRAIKHRPSCSNLNWILKY
ncbi:hypothetical protein QE193_23455 (plasmid) [Arsenophonus nasoniae]|uniref:hypothetical protein n=1 Tax=Arsenophonus nasoniae TaxID=638 RepID=UPI002469A73C|nr:hypothetical protein [Arsenophonus nasoniae]WGM18169.1 hypothetical protein QE193_23455 [Arsenophonus nasoniae]